MERQVRFSTSADGTQIGYAWYGKPGRTPLFHVFSFDYAIEAMWHDVVWQEWLEGLGEERLVVVFDRRGTGASERKVHDVSLEAQLSDVTSVADHFGCQTFDLGGSGDGANIAAVYAARFPERVAHLVLFSPYVRGEDWIRPETARGMTDLIGSNWELGSRLLASLVGPEASSQEQERRSKWLRTLMLPEVALQISELLTTLDISALLPEVRVPAMVMSFARDSRSIRASSMKVASLIPGAHFIDLSDRPMGRETNVFLLERVQAFLDEGQPSVPAAIAADVATILFTDIESSTALTQRLGDVRAQDLVRTHNAIVRDALASNGGTEIKHTGDGIMACFSSPSRALECSLSIQRGITARAEEDPAAPLAVRIGLNAGEPVVEEADLFGSAVQLARRICDHAGAGEILVSDVVRQLAAGKGFLFADRGEVLPKGFEEPVRLYELRWQQ